MAENEQHSEDPYLYPFCRDGSCAPPIYMHLRAAADLHQVQCHGNTRTDTAHWTESVSTLTVNRSPIATSSRVSSRGWQSHCIAVLCYQTESDLPPFCDGSLSSSTFRHLSQYSSATERLSSFSPLWRFLNLWFHQSQERISFRTLSVVSLRDITTVESGA